MKKPLKALLNAMDKIAEEYEEVTDTAVREEMASAIESALLTGVAGYELPDDFGMFEPKGNAKVKVALAKFIAAALIEVEVAGLKTREDRLRAFQDDEVESSEGNTYDEYFGYDDSLEK
ncbi:MAG: hypothetical protein ACRC8S_02740 [Fimbriiglobus sp.]